MARFWIIVLVVAAFGWVSSFEIPKECVGETPNALGVCRKSFTGYFFNIITKQCQKYATDGCALKAGNAHSFATKLDCVRKCKEPLEAIARSQK